MKWRPGEVIGENHRIEFFTNNRPDDFPEDDVAGLTHYHPAGPLGPDGHEMCAGAAFFRGMRHPDEPGPEWDVLSENPLTLAPSLLCTVCGRHGFIRDGRWVEA